MNGECYHSQKPSVVKTILHRFDEKAVEDFFMELGILPKEKDGYVYPNSMQAASVLDALRFELERLHVTILTDTDVQNIKTKGKGFQVISERETFHCRRLILACGGKASEKLGSNGSGLWPCREPWSFCDLRRPGADRGLRRRKESIRR